MMPEVAYNTSLDRCIFCFEELENNLHPAIQKRLFRYLSEVVKNDHCTMFITTHSHVVIDLFSGDVDAQLIHVTHDENDRELSHVQRITTRVHHNKLFDDLGVKASDLLQSNCVIWVEGPSDRTYFNRWIELFDPHLKEHDDYEFAFTAGTLLGHVGYDDTNAELNIEALRINRNAIVLMDSDRKDPSMSLKARVNRVVEELTPHGLPWVTVGKEVENYIPIEALRVLLGKPDLESPEPHTSIFEFIKTNGGREFSGVKLLLAQKICETLDRSMLEKCLDLGSRMDEVCQRIRRWNARDEKNLS